MLAEYLLLIVGAVALGGPSRLRSAQMILIYVEMNETASFEAWSAL